MRRSACQRCRAIRVATSGRAPDTLAIAVPTVCQLGCAGHSLPCTTKQKHIVVHLIVGLEQDGLHSIDVSLHTMAADRQDYTTEPTDIGLGTTAIRPTCDTEVMVVECGSASTLCCLYHWCPYHWVPKLFNTHRLFDADRTNGDTSFRTTIIALSAALTEPEPEPSPG